MSRLDVPERPNAAATNPRATRSETLRRKPSSASGVRSTSGPYSDRLLKDAPHFDDKLIKLASETFDALSIDRTLGEILDYSSLALKSMVPVRPEVGQPDLAADFFDPIARMRVVNMFPAPRIDLHQFRIDASIQGYPKSTLTF